jgi:hypothetical protein
MNVHDRHNFGVCHAGRQGWKMCRLARPQPVSERTRPFQLDPNQSNVDNMPMHSIEPVKDADGLLLLPSEGQPFPKPDQRNITWELRRPDITKHIPSELRFLPGRLQTSNGNVVETLRALDAVSCVTNAQLVSSDLSAHAISEYIAGYMLQDVTRLRAAASLVINSGVHVMRHPSQATDSGCSRRTAMHWIERYCNSLISSRELSEQQLALASLGHNSVIHSSQHSCVFVDPLVRLLANTQKLDTDSTHDAAELWMERKTESMRSGTSSLNANII